MVGHVISGSSLLLGYERGRCTGEGIEQAALADVSRSSQHDSNLGIRGMPPLDLKQRVLYFSADISQLVIQCFLDHRSFKQVMGQHMGTANWLQYSFPSQLHKQ